jgi:phosphate transport system substrate-binding protein
VGSVVRGLWLGVLLAAGYGTGSAAAADDSLHGAGATFPAPVYLAWSVAYADEHHGTVSYESVGSGAGLERIINRQVDFGASDAPLPKAELAARELLQVPLIIGGVVPVINIRGIKPGGLRLSGEVLGDIYLGRIRKWNAPAIARLNPEVALPNTYITVVHRVDASGSTWLWTDYLSKTNAEWRARIGTSLTPAWPLGVSGTGNEGVAAYVQRTRFALGYVEYAYARQHRLSDVALLNQDGATVRGSRASFAAAADALSEAESGFERQMPTNLPGRATWPVTGASFVLVSTRAEEQARTRRAFDFIAWALHHGDSIASNLDYVPLPKRVAEQVASLVH